MTENVRNYREFLRGNLWDGWDEMETDRKKQLPPPLPQKPHPEDTKLIDLVAPDDLTVGKMPLIETIKRRKSRRKFSPDHLTLEELSFLLWATQGVQQVLRDGWITRRTVPAGGSLHSFETYLFVYQDRVEGLETGLYRYLPVEHKLCLLSCETALAEKVTHACRAGHKWVQNSAVLFVWTAIPYRKEWVYSIIAAKLIALDAGHVCQNLYLASEAIGAGTCAIGAFDQTEIDAVIGVDGEEEFVIYVAPVGKI